MPYFKFLFTVGFAVVMLFSMEPILKFFATNRKLEYISLTGKVKWETLAGAVTVSAALAYKMEEIPYAIMAVALYACLLASIFDIMYRKIPNDIVVALLLLGIGYSVAVKCAWWSPILGFVIAAVIFILPSFFGMGCGAGDVKFIMALGILAGFPDIMYAILGMGAATAAFTYGKYAGVAGMKLAAVNKTKIPLSPFITAGYVALLLLRVYGLISL